MKQRLQSWRPLTLCWASPIRRVAPSIARTILHTTHQHFHSTLQLHVAATMPPRERASTVTTLVPGTPTATRLINATHTEHRSRTLHHIRTNTSQVQRQSTSVLARRVERVHTVSMTNVMPAPARIVTEPAGAPSPEVVRRAQESAPSSPPRWRTPLTFAATAKGSRTPTIEQSSAPKPARAPAPPASLIWRKPPSPAADHVEEHDGLDTGSQPALTRTGTAAPAVAAAVPTITPQQTREAVRANLLDSAVADRLADDVIRRVEKRMRIERERRGL